MHGMHDLTDAPEYQILQEEMNDVRPELVIDKSDLTKAAKELAELIALRDRFLFNGNMAVQIIHEAGFPPSAKEVTIEAVRIFAHEICKPVKTVQRKGKDGKAKAISFKVTLSGEVANLYLQGLDGQRG